MTPVEQENDVKVNIYQTLSMEKKTQKYTITVDKWFPPWGSPHICVDFSVLPPVGIEM